MLFCFVFSEDFALLKHKIDEISETFFSSTMLSTAKHTFWGDEGLSNNFWQILNSSSLDPKADLIILRHAEKIDAENFKALSNALGTLRDNTLVILCIESDWDKKGPKTPVYITSQQCYIYAKKKNWFYLVPPLDGQSIGRYIQKGLNSRSLSANPQMQNMLAQMLPLQASNVDNTLDQLVLAVGTNPIEEKDLYNLSASTPEILLYDHIKNLENGKFVNIWSALLHEEKAEDIFFAFSSMLTREARLLWQILHNDVPSSSSWLVNDRKRSIAHKLGKRNIATLFSILSEADWSIKSGRKNVAQSMEELLFRLSYIYK